MSSRAERTTLLVAVVGASGIIGLGAVMTMLRSGPAAPTEYERLQDTRVAQMARSTAIAERALLAERADSLLPELTRHEWPADSLLLLADPQLPDWRRDGDAALLRRSLTAIHPSPGGIR